MAVCLKRLHCIVLSKIIKLKSMSVIVLFMFLVIFKTWRLNLVKKKGTTGRKFGNRCFIQFFIWYKCLTISYHIIIKKYQRISCYFYSIIWKAISASTNIPKPLSDNPLRSALLVALYLQVVYNNRCCTYVLTYTINDDGDCL